MKHICKPQLLFVLSCLCLIKPVMSSAQIAYDYDNAGNRTARKVINMTPKYASKGTEAKPDSVIELLSGVEVLAYPNPAEEVLNVEAKGLKENEKVLILLFSSQGALVFKKETLASFTPIDMNACLPGVYILRISTGKKKTDIKMIKQ